MPPKEVATPGGDPPSDEYNMLARFSTLLGAFRLKNTEHPRRSNDDCLSTLFAAHSETRCSVPSLALNALDAKENHIHYPSKDKQVVEQHAASNLSRALQVFNMAPHVTSGTDSTEDKTAGQLLCIRQLPHTILDNLAESFLSLKDARLRAYITILARHGVNLSKMSVLTEEQQQAGVLAVERKWATLIQVGTGITIDNMVIFFHLDDEEVARGDDDQVVLPIVMESTMDVSIPNFSCEHGFETVTIGASAKGQIKAVFDKDERLISTVEVDIDTHELLAVLIDRASFIMSKALDNVREVCALPPELPQAPLPKHYSSADMMPPPPVRVQVSAKNLAVVSPDIVPQRKEPIVVEPLELDEMKAISELTPESCANIVDFVIGDVDHIIFPPFKKLKRTTA